MQVDKVETIYLISNNSVENYPNTLTRFTNDLPGHQTIDPLKYDVSCFGVGLSLELPYVLLNVDETAPVFAVIHPLAYKLWKKNGVEYGSVFDYVKTKYLYHVKNNQQSLHSITQDINLYLQKCKIKPLSFFFINNRLIIKHTNRKRLHAIIDKEFFKQLGLQNVKDSLDTNQFHHNNKVYYHIIFSPQTVYKGKRLAKINPDFHPAIVNISCKQIKPYPSRDGISQTILSFPISEKYFKKYCTFEPRYPDKFQLNTESLTSLDIEVLDENRDYLPITSGSPTIVKLQLTRREMNRTFTNIVVSSKHSLFPGNTPNDFYYKLNLPLTVSSNAQIRLKQLTYPSRICNISHEFSKLLFYVDLHEQATSTVGNIERGHPLFKQYLKFYGSEQEIDRKFCFCVDRNCYSTNEELLSFFNGHNFLRNLLKFDYKNGTCVITAKKKCTLYVPQNFQHIMGLGPDQYLEIVNEDQIDGGANTYIKAYTTVAGIDDSTLQADYGLHYITPYTRTKRGVDPSVTRKYIKLKFHHNFDPNDQTKNQLVLPEPLNVNKFFPTNLILYSDVVRPTAVGNIEAQVMKAFTPSPSINKYSQIYFDYNENKLLNTTLIDMMHFKLRTDYGEPVDFMYMNDEITLSLCIVENHDN